MTRHIDEKTLNGRQYIKWTTRHLMNKTWSKTFYVQEKKYNKYVIYRQEIQFGRGIMSKYNR